MTADECVMDFNKICRLCLTEESFMSSIYNEQDKHTTEVPLPLRIMACVSIELNSLDGLPSHICTTCLCQVDGWYKFKDLCETADAVLRKCMKNEPVEVETISEIKCKAQEVRQFFASPHLVKVEGLDSALNQLNSRERNVEISDGRNEQVPSGCRQKYLVYLNPDAYFKYLQSEYNLNEKLELKRVPESKKIGTRDCGADYEIAFDSPIERPKKKNCGREKFVMELGDCQLLEIYSKEEDGPVVTEEVDEDNVVPVENVCDRFQESSSGECLGFGGTKVDQVLANYDKTKEYLERNLRERGNIHEEFIENVLYTFRLDEDGQVDVVNIVEGVTEPSLNRGFRYACLFCSKIVLNKLVYDKHIREFHLDYLVCKVCDKQLYSMRNFLIHTKTHLGVYTFTCPLCGKGLTRASIFKSHMMYHYYGKMQKCQICEKRFRDVFALRRHVQLHDKKIEFVCELCGFGTHLKSNLEYHARGHTEEKMFMCEMCGKQFAAPQSLQHHMKTHEPNFPCPHCKRVYRHESKFINHLEQNHSDLIRYIVDEKEAIESGDDGGDTNDDCGGGGESVSQFLVDDESNVGVDTLEY